MKHIEFKYFDTPEVIQIIQMIDKEVEKEIGLFTIGIIVSKQKPEQLSSGKKLVRFQLSDLRKVSSSKKLNNNGYSLLNLIAFGDGAQLISELRRGIVVAILNPKLGKKNKENNNQTFYVQNGDKNIMILG